MGIEEWRKHLMNVFNDMKSKNEHAKLKEAMIQAKKTYKKGGSKCSPKKPKTLRKKSKKILKKKTFRK